MKIKYLGHSAFQLSYNSGAEIVCDPYPEEVGFKMAEVSAGAVTVSHHHFDHDYTSAVRGNPKVFDSVGEYNFGGVQISTVVSFHDSFGGAKRGKNIIFKFTAEGLTVCHLGDLGEDCNQPLIDKIGKVDVLLIPVGGNYTIDAATAKSYVDKIKPKVVIPMHYRVAGCNIDIQKQDAFLSLFKGEGVQIEEVKGGYVPDTGANGTLKIVVMERCGQ